MPTDPKEKCASCGITRDGHWGPHPIAERYCTGFVSEPSLSVVPLSLETAQYIRDRVNIESNQSANFVAMLTKFHESSPKFTAEFLRFLQLCEVSKLPSYRFIDAGQG